MIQAGYDITSAIEDLTTTTEECAEDITRKTGTPCATKRIVGAIESFVSQSTGVSKNTELLQPGAKTLVENTNNLLPNGNDPGASAIRNAAKILNCNSESCIIGHSDFRKFVINNKIATPHELKLELEMRYKAAGPRSDTKWLSNFNIDETLQRWARKFEKFYPCPFAMIDFNTNGDVFGTINMKRVMSGRMPLDLGPGIGVVKRSTNCFACVLNTDVSTGPGKHWVAVFVDCRGEHCTIEYFNSAGNPPPRTVTAWMEKTRIALIEFGSKIVDTVAVTDQNHQQSKTECGSYSLYYIRRRLENTPYEYFNDNIIPDAAMIEFRTHLFRDGK